MGNTITIVATIAGMIVSLVGCTWYLGSKIGSIEASVESIRTNDLHSVEHRLGRIEDILMDRR